MKINWWPATIAGLVSLLLFATFVGENLMAHAQTAKTTPAPKTSPKPRMAGAKSKGGSNAGLKKLLAQLNLTPDQVTKLKAAEAASKKTTDGIKANKTLTADQQKLLVRAESKNLRTKAAAILTPAQQEKFKSLMLQAAMARKNRPAGKGVVSSPALKPAHK